MNKLELWAEASMIVAVAVAALTSSSSANAAEEYSGSNTDVRTILAYTVSPNALKAFVPQGWELSSFKEGPSAGANLQVEFVDQLFATDTGGKVGAPYRYVLFGMPVHKTGSNQDVLMLFDGLSRGGAGPYQIAETAADEVSRSEKYGAGPTVVEESWKFEGGGEMASLQLEFERGPLEADAADSHVYSAVKPSFNRIYRFKEGADVVEAEGKQTQRIHTYAFTATGGKLDALFNGSEKLVSVVSLPVYSREILLPAL